MQQEKDKTKLDLQHKVKIKEQEVLKYELSSLKPTAKVYRQQQNSSVLFLSGMEQEMARAKQNLDSLQKEYQHLEASSSSDQAEDETDQPCNIEHS